MAVCSLPEDVPTLRLVTLRRLVKGVAPSLVFEETTPLESIAEALHDDPDATAVLVDRDSVLQGTLRLAELADWEGDVPAAWVMERGAPVLEAENDIEAARYAMRKGDTDRVVIVSPSGELLGILTDRDLTRSRAA
jgi:Mg/Co/Ni transporter MgtE